MSSSGLATSVEALVSRHAGLVYRLALRITGSPADAEEVTWEVMEIVWRKILSFRGDSALSSWIYRIATNAAYGKLRAWPVPSFPLEEIPSRLDEAEPWVSASPDWSALSEDIEGLANAEVAGILGVSLSAVKSRVHRARLALRQRLASYFASWSQQ